MISAWSNTLHRPELCLALAVVLLANRGKVKIMTRFTTLLSLALLAAAGSAPASAQPVDPVTRQQGTVLL
jgi:hypothetical protein